MEIRVAPLPAERGRRLAQAALLVGVPLVPWAFWTYALRHPLTFTFVDGRATANDTTLAYASWLVLASWTIVLAATPLLTTRAWPGLARRGGTLRVMGAMLATLASGWAAFLVESQHLCSQSAAVASVADAGFWATYLAAGTWAMRTPRRALVAWPLVIAAAFGVAVLLRLLLLGGAQTCTI